MEYLAIIALFASLAQSPDAGLPGFMRLSSQALKTLEERLGPKVDQNNSAMERLGNFGNHSLMAMYRKGDGEAELHESQADIFVVESGEATLIVGGTVIDGRVTGVGEVRGRAISGGELKGLSPGDIVHIPAKMPHQVLVASGKQVSYVIVKVDVPKQ